MYHLTINADSYYFPENWNEIEYKHFRALVETGIGEPLLDEMRILLLLRFTGLRVVQKQVRGNIYLLEGKQQGILQRRKQYRVALWQLQDACTSLDWLFHRIETSLGEPPQYSIEYRVIRNLMLVLSVRRLQAPFPHHYFGPADGLSNLRFSEYIDAEIAHSHYCDTHDPADLDALIATLYRPLRRRLNRRDPSWDGDVREIYNPYLTERYIRHIRRIDPITKQMILAWYRTCGFFLQTRYPHMFSNSKKSGTKSEVFDSFMKMIDGLSNSDVTKKEAVRESYLYDAFETINEIVRRTPEFEKKH